MWLIISSLSTHNRYLLFIVLSVSFPMAVYSPPSCFPMLSSNPYIDASTLSSMLASPLPPSFLHTHSLSTSSLWCSVLCMVISFLVLWFIYLSSSLVHFRKGSEYLMRGTAQVFIPFIRFLQLSFVSSIFLVLLQYSFWILSLFSTCLMVYIPRCPSICRFRFLRALEFFESVLSESFHWNLSDSRSLQVSRTLLSILVILNNVVVWIVSTCPPNSKSSLTSRLGLLNTPTAPRQRGKTPQRVS